VASTVCALHISFPSRVVVISHGSFDHCSYSTGKLTFFYYLVCDNYSYCVYFYDTFISVFFLQHKADIDNRQSLFSNIDVFILTPAFSIAAFRTFIGTRVTLLLAQGRQLIQVFVVYMATVNHNADAAL
jgi:hypothetical protein